MPTNFDLSNQKVENSCGVTFQNKHFIFGGRKSNARQILQLDDCRLINIGSLAFDHDGACGSTNGVMVLCFNNAENGDGKRCRQASSPTEQWSEVALSMYEHRHTSVATSKGTQFCAYKVLKVGLPNKT